MTAVKKPRIRKVWLPTEMKTALDEMLWKYRDKPSPHIASIVREFVQDPDKYRGLSIPPAGKDYASVYISDDDWLPAVEQANAMGVQLSAVVRARIAQELEAEGITWTVSTARPKNARIPIRE